MLYGIRGRLVGTYLLIIILTVVFFEAVILWAVNTYYMDNIRNILKNQSEIAGNFYSGYLADTDLEDNVNKVLDNFSGLPVQIQIINGESTVIGDSLHATYGLKLRYSDIKEAINGKQGIYKGKDDITHEEVLSYSVPLKGRNGIAGVARFTTSLEPVNKTIRTISFYIIVVGFAIILLVFLISLYLSRTIINPIKHITKISDEMAKGNLTVRSKKLYNDEIGILSESLNHMASEIQRNEKLKNEFISSISHELRTPLTSIRGWAMTLAETKPDETDVMNRGIYIINNEAERLSDMVEELLDFSRLQSGKFTLQIQEIDMNKLVWDVLEQMKPRADRQCMKLEFDIPQHPQTMKVDPRRLKQVLINLLDNALKYTPPDGLITVTSRINGDIGDNVYIITIKDNGTGISEHDLPLIKQRFYRGNNTASDSGIGLGLSICDELVKAHGGFMEIESEVGKGTCITVKFPIKN